MLFEFRLGCACWWSIPSSGSRLLFGKGSVAQTQCIAELKTSLCPEKLNEIFHTCAGTCVGFIFT